MLYTFIKRTGFVDGTCIMHIKLNIWLFIDTSFIFIIAQFSEVYTSWQNMYHMSTNIVYY